MVHFCGQRAGTAGIQLGRAVVRVIAVAGGPRACGAPPSVPTWSVDLTVQDFVEAVLAATG